jgi:hypothetical protein
MRMTKSRSESLVILGSIAALCAFTIARYVERHAPYFSAPETIVDHVDKRTHDNRDLLVLLPKIEPLIPRNVEVTCFRPLAGQQQFDGPNYLAAVGLLPHRSVLPPFTAAADLPVDQLVEYVIAIREPFAHPAYRVVASYPEGTLYRVNR